MIQIRNVPDAVHKKLRARADAAGLSLSDYLLGELRRVLERPTRAELLARIAQRERVETQPASAEAVRAERDAR
jgi:plasmid stability protein